MSRQGQHLINGEWVAGTATFTSAPANGEPREYSVGSSELVARACEVAEAAFTSYGFLPRSTRAQFLQVIAEQIEKRGDEITAIGTTETALPAARLEGERGRTIGQLKLFADHIAKGDYLDRRHDAALPERSPLPRPDLRLIQQPVGPVAVFGASNFPLAFSVAGGDTASALAAGCPVIVKAHSAHPGTSEIVAEAILAAIEECDLPRGVFGMVHGGSREVGAALVTHPLIQAVGFTGSLAGGRALFDLCAAREQPIPFFGELGSVNPVFVLPAACQQRGSEIATGWVASLTLGVGQFCTNPGILVLPQGEVADKFIAVAKAELAKIDEQTMLTHGIATAYQHGQEQMANNSKVTEILRSEAKANCALPSLYQTTAVDWLADPQLGEEVFGPLGLIVTASSDNEYVALAKKIAGQLTCTLQTDDADTELAKSLVPILTRKAGRLLANGFPTGVEVADAMVHGGPYPASTNFGATSVGTLAIRRFLRPICYQNMPETLLPADLVN